MIVGIGVDVCNLERFKDTLERTPALAERLFTDAERGLSLDSLAARFSAKEALAKALGAPSGLNWHDAEVGRARGGAPEFRLSGSVLEAARQRGVETTHLSLSHDAGVAVAMVILESA